MAGTAITTSTVGTAIIAAAICSIHIGPPRRSSAGSRVVTSGASSPITAHSPTGRSVTRAAKAASPTRVGDRHASGSERTGSGRRRTALAAALALALGTIALPQPAFAQFSFSLGGMSLSGSRGGYGGRGEGMRVQRPGGYGGTQGGMRPQRPGYPNGMGRPGGMGGYPTGMVRPQPYPTRPPGTGRPYPGRPPVMGQPYPRPPWGMQPGYPTRPPPYRPPVMVDDEPYARPRRPVMIAQPPVRQLRPLRLQRPAYAAPATPRAPTARPVAPRPSSPRRTGPMWTVRFWSRSPVRSRLARSAGSRPSGV